jgi:hypothetical protein
MLEMDYTYRGIRGIPTRLWNEVSLLKSFNEAIAIQLYMASHTLGGYSRTM